MDNYTFDITKYRLVTESGETYKDFLDMLPAITVQADNYILATLKAEKLFPSERYVHQLIHTDADKYPSSGTLF